MKAVDTILVSPYSPSIYGLLQSKKRLARIYFTEPLEHKPDDPEKVYGRLLEDVFRKLAVHPLRPAGLPDEPKVEWRQRDQAFVIHGDDMHGFRIDVRVVELGDDDGIGPETLTAGRGAVAGADRDRNP